MSELLRELATYIRDAPRSDIHVVRGHEHREDEPTLAPARPETGKARMAIAGSSLDGVDVGAPRPGRLAYFMDGMERQRVIMYCSMAPVVYGYVAAVIRMRGSDRRMRTYEGGAVSSEALYLPQSMVDLSGFGRPVVNTVDREGGDSRAIEHPMMLLEAARKKVSGARDRLERQVTSEWLARFDGADEWLMVDGSLVGDYDRYATPNIVGVVKSHQTQYFPLDEQRKVLALEVGERSGVFIPEGRNRPEVYSWYLRLRPNAGEDVYFGLVRVEAAKCDRTLEMVDEICCWLLAERSPLSMPDWRWDRMLYPIRDCELYLKSQAPSNAMLDALMAGLCRSGQAR